MLRINMRIPQITNYANYLIRIIRIRSIRINLRIRIIYIIPKNKQKTNKKGIRTCPNTF